MNTLASKTKKTIKEPRFRTDSEREVLRVLWAHKGKGLVRSQIYHRMALPPKERPTTHRIGQILKMLLVHGYLESEHDRFQGRTKAAFYRLNRKGKQACRVHYKFEKKDQALFHLTDEMRQKYLTAENFDGSEEAQTQRIIGFYAYSTGLDQAVIVAHTANALAQHSKEKQILVVDLNFENPELDHFFPAPPDRSNRCFRRLFAEFQRQPDWRKDKWLEEAIEEGSYTYRARPERLSNLHFLRSGMQETLRELTDVSERTSVLERLQTELGVEGFDSRLSEEFHFLHNFRLALLKKYDLILICAQSARSLSALATTQIVDQLVMSARPTESPQALGGLQAVAAWFLRSQRLTRQANPGILMILHLSEYSSGRFKGTKWLRDKILHPNGAGPLPEKLPWVLRHNRLLENPTDWRATEVFRPLAKRLLDPTYQQNPLHPAVKAVDTLLDPKARMDYRIMMAASLEDVDFGTFSQALNAWLGDEDLEHSTDDVGLKMLREAIEDHQRKIVTKLGG